MCSEGAPRSSVHTVNIFKDFLVSHYKYNTKLFAMSNHKAFFHLCSVLHFLELSFSSILKNLSLWAMAAAAASTSAGLRAISASVKLLPASSAPNLTNQKSLLFKPSNAVISQNLRLTAAPATANGRRSFTCKSQASPADSGSSKCFIFFTLFVPKLIYSINP